MAIDDNRLQELRVLGEAVRSARGILRVEQSVQKALGIDPNHPDAEATRTMLFEHIVRAAEAVPGLVDEVESLKNVLRKIEWNGDVDGDSSCPLCGGRKPIHHSRCEIGGAAL
jgi:hypothetical protein